MRSKHLNEIRLKILKLLSDSKFSNYIIKIIKMRYGYLFQIFLPKSYK